MSKLHLDSFSLKETYHWWKDTQELQFDRHLIMPAINTLHIDLITLQISGASSAVRKRGISGVNSICNEDLCVGMRSYSHIHFVSYLDLLGN